MSSHGGFSFVSAYGGLLIPAGTGRGGDITPGFSIFALLPLRSARDAHTHTERERERERERDGGEE